MKIEAEDDLTTVLVDATPMSWVVIHMRDREVFTVQHTVNDVEFCVVAHVAGHTVSKAVLP